MHPRVQSPTLPRPYIKGIVNVNKELKSAAQIAFSGESQLSIILKEGKCLPLSKLFQAPIPCQG